MSNAVNFSNTTPAAPSGNQNVTFQADTSSPPNISGYVPAVPTKTSQLANDAGFVTAANAPVTSVEGKTGAVTLTPANIGAAANGANSDITSLSGLTTPIGLSEGGTGANTATLALTNLGAASLSANNTFSGNQTFNNPAGLAFGANWQNWTPTISGSGSMTTSNPSIIDAQYLRIGPVCHFKIHFTVSLGGSPYSAVLIGLPITLVGQQCLAPAWFSQGNWSPGLALVNSSLIYVYQTGLANFALGNIEVYVEGSYRVV